MLEHLLRNHPNSNGLTLLCDTIDDALATLETAQLASWQVEPTRTCSSYRIVVQRWQRVPAQETLVKDLLGQMAQVLLRLWPQWYGRQDLSLVDHFSTTLAFDRQRQDLLDHLLATAPAQRANLSLTWLQAAADRCRRGELPLLPHFPHDQQLAQLACAIDPNRLIILLAVDDLTPQPFHLYGLARLLVWLRQATPIQINLLLPTALAEHAELESVRYGAIHLPSSLPTPTEQSNADEAVEQHRSSVWPIQGKPHPFSPGEQQLAAQLALDLELASLFQCNAMVHTVHHSSYYADLLWSAGRVVVEIDGYKIHSRRAAFRADRHRDYELLLSGYLVLRLSHDEVMQDVELAVEKIRDVVRFRRGQKKTPPHIKGINQ